MPQLPKDKLMNAPLKNAKGLGSSHHGVDHWISQKVTAVANLPLILWFVYSMLTLAHDGGSYEQFTAWVAAPLNTVLLIAMFLSVYYHAKLGAQVVVEDYVSTVWKRRVKLVLQKYTFALFTIATIVAILKIAFTAGL